MTSMGSALNANGSHFPYRRNKITSGFVIPFHNRSGSRWIYRHFTGLRVAHRAGIHPYVRKITSSRLNILTASASAAAAYNAVEPKMTEM